MTAPPVSRLQLGPTATDYDKQVALREIEDKLNAMRQYLGTGGTAPGGGVSQEDFDALVADVAELEGRIAAIEAEEPPTGNALTSSTTTTPSIANNAYADVTLALSCRSASVEQVVASAHCWILAYPRAAERTADTRTVDDAESTTEDAPPNVLCMLDVVPGSGGQTLSPELRHPAEIRNADEPRTDIVYLRVYNLSGAAAAIAVTFYFTPTGSV